MFGDLMWVMIVCSSFFGVDYPIETAHTECAVIPMESAQLCTEQGIGLTTRAAPVPNDADRRVPDAHWNYFVCLNNRTHAPNYVTLSRKQFKELAEIIRYNDVKRDVGTNRGN
jgi:hypothetical protein